MRRSLVTVILTGIVVVVGGLLWRDRGQVQSYIPVGPGDSYLALGDSIAAGFTVSDPREAYVPRIAARLRRLQPEIRVRNIAVPGATTGSLLAAQLPQALQFIREEQRAGRRVSPITIDIGGNDARAAEQGNNDERLAAIGRVERNLRRILEQLRGATTDRWGKASADIVVMNYYNPYGGDPEDDRSAAYWTAQLNLAIARAASAYAVPVADVATAFEGGLAYRYTYIAAGDIHPNPDGHAVIAEQFWRALRYGDAKNPAVR